MKTVLGAVIGLLVIAAGFAVRRAEADPQARPAASSAGRLVTIDDYFQIRDVGQPELSPDGQWVAYTVRTKMLKEDKNETRIWMISTHGGDPLPMTAEGVSSGHPRWSPDGKYLAFTSSRNGGKSQVWLLNRLGGEAVKLTDITQGVNDFESLPDSTRLVLALRDSKPEDAEAEKEKDRPDGADQTENSAAVRDRSLRFKEDTVGYLDSRRTHLYVFDCATKTTTVQITSGSFDDEQPTWSPDGSSGLHQQPRPRPIPTHHGTRTSGWSPPTTPIRARISPRSPRIRERIASPPGLPTGNGSPTSRKSIRNALLVRDAHIGEVSPAGGGEAKVLTADLRPYVRRPEIFRRTGKFVYFVADG